MSSDNPELDVSAPQNNQADVNHQSNQPASDSAEADASKNNQAGGEPPTNAGLRPVRPLAIGAGVLVLVLLIIGISRLTGGGGGSGLTSAGQSALTGTGQSGLLGQWHKAYYTDDSGNVDENDVTTFNADGTCTAKQMPSGDTCTYGVAGDTLNLTVKSKGVVATEPFSYSVAGDVLTLTSSANGMLEVDVRVGGSANAASVAATADACGALC